MGKWLALLCAAQVLSAAAALAQGGSQAEGVSILGRRRAAAGLYSGDKCGWFWFAVQIRRCA